ncbi:hypothetical protein LCGC14_2570420, partial [marine sediment metagenome]
ARYGLSSDDPLRPLFYGLSEDDLRTLVPSAGSVPTNCRAIAIYAQRLVLAGDTAAPNTWNMSAPEDFTNWDYAEGPGNPDPAVTGTISPAIVSLIPFRDDLLIFGCANSLLMMRGDPVTGSIDLLSPIHGVIDQAAWAYGPNEELFLLGRDGLYFVMPEKQSDRIRVHPLSKAKVPRELLDVHRDSAYVTMLYDLRHDGIHIFLTPTLEGSHGLHWWFDLTSQSFWPVSFFDGGSKLQPTVGMVHASDVPPVTRVLMGGWDGYLRFYDDSVSSDDGESFSNHVVYGPMLLGKSGAHEGMITELIGVPAEGSGDVDWELKVGKTIERAKNATAFTSGTWREGINRTIRTRARGYAWYLKLKGKGGAPWAMERITAGLQTTGRQQYA